MRREGYQTEEVLKEERRLRMNCKFVVNLAAVLLVTSLVSWGADDGAASYKKKCAGCHGANGEGKPTIKSPALKGTKLEASQIVEHTTKGEPNSKPPHNKAIAGVNEEQANAIAEFVKTLK
jgi:mono/diheme cytochrome c family protein